MRSEKGSFEVVLRTRRGGTPFPRTNGQRGHAGFKALLPADGPMPAPKKVPSLARLFVAELQGQTTTLKAASGERHEPQKQAR